MMKIIGSIDRCYRQQLDANRKLKKRVDCIIEYSKEDTWHYFGRIKTKESCALKIEAGHKIDPYNLDDFFACTIVVENNSEIEKAVELVRRFFNIESRKPISDKFTHMAPSSFLFDDLRLYVRLKYDERLPQKHKHNTLSGILFEIQIKTFLQHAWAIAAHKLIYKEGELSWSKQRIAYQTKAMLEHAEISIYEIEKIKESKMLNKRNRKTEELKKIKKFLARNWKEDKLPVASNRLAENVDLLIKALGINIAKLQKLLNVESSSGKGTKTLNLSPYFIIVQTIINQDPKRIRIFLDNAESTSKIIIPAEIDIGDMVLNNDKVIRIE